MTAPRLRVDIQAPAGYEAHAERLRSGLRGAALAVPAEDGEPADHRAYLVLPRAARSDPVPQLGAVTRAYWVVVGQDGRLAMPVHWADEPGVADALVESFEKLARYRNGLSLTNSAPDSAIRGRVDLLLQVARSDGSWGDVHPGEDGQIVLHEGDGFRLEVVNRHDVPMYAAILDFGLTARIDLLYPFGGPSEAIDPGGSLVVGE